MEQNTFSNFLWEDMIFVVGMVVGGGKEWSGDILLVREGVLGLPSWYIRFSKNACTKHGLQIYLDYLLLRHGRVKGLKELRVGTREPPTSSPKSFVEWKNDGQSWHYTTLPDLQKPSIKWRGEKKKKKKRKKWVKDFLFFSPQN
jgi:hypothetical protein